MATSLKLDADQIHPAIRSVAAAISRRHPRPASLLLLGIANGGIGFARRLARLLKSDGRLPAVGTIDISFHRDDIGRHPVPKEFAPSFIPQDVNGATIILVDDVLQSGRTVKAALDELFDHGRPAKVELAVLVDRGDRRLPVAADYCGLRVEAPGDRKVIVRLDPDDESADSIELPAPAAKVSA